MKKSVFLTLGCLTTLVILANVAMAVPATNIRVSSIKTNTIPQGSLPSKNTMPTDVSTSSAVNTITNSISAKQSNTEKTISSVETARLGAKKIKPTSITSSSKPSNTTSNTNTTTPSASQTEIALLQEQIELLQNQITTLHQELAQKAEKDSVQQLNNTITNKIDEMDTKFVKDRDLEQKFNTLVTNNLDDKFVEIEKLDTKIDNHLSGKGFLKTNEVDSILQQKGVLKTEDKNNIINLIRIAKQDALDDAESKYLTPENSQGILAGYAKKSDVANDIAAAKQDTNTKIVALNSRVATAEGSIEPQQLRKHFETFLGDELDKTTDNKFSRFTKNIDLNARIESLDGKFETKGAISDAFDTSNENSVLSRALKDTTKGLGKKFKDVNDTVTSHGTALNNIDNTIEGKIAGKGLLTGKQLKDAISGDDTTSELAGVLNTKFNKFTKNDELNSKIANLDNFKALGTRLGAAETNISNHGTALNNIDNTIEGKITDKGLLTGKQLKDAISGDDTTSELAGVLNTKFNKFTKNEELNSKIANLDSFKALGTRLGTAETNIATNTSKFANYTTTAGLKSAFKGESGADSDLKSAFNSKFANYTDNSNLNAKIASLDNFKALGTRLGTAETNIESNTNKFANYTTTSGLTNVLKGTDTTSTLGKALNDSSTGRFANLATKTYADNQASAAQTAAISAAASSVDTKLGNYTTTSGLTSVLNGTDKTSTLGKALNDSSTGRFANLATKTYADNQASAAQTAAISAAASNVDTKLSNYTTTAGLTNVLNGSDTTSALGKTLNGTSGRFSNYTTTSALAQTLSGDNSVTTLAGLKNKLATKSEVQALDAGLTEVSSNMVVRSDSTFTPRTGFLNP